MTMETGVGSAAGNSQHVELTTVRGIACLIVVVGHTFSFYDVRTLLHESGLAYHIFEAFYAGMNGVGSVALFFVLSGCVLSMSLDSGRRKSPSWIADFYVKRAFRIYPLLWTSLALSLAVLGVARTTSGLPGLTPWASTAMPNFVSWSQIALAAIGAFTHINPPMWSLRAEIFYSLVFPLLFSLVVNDRYRWITLGVLAALAALPIPTEWGAHYAIAFAAGAAIPRLQPPRPRYGGVLALMVPIFLYSRFVLERLGVSYHGIQLCEIAYSILIVRCLFFSVPRVAILHARPLQFIGEISYSIYLLHFPILYVCASITDRLLGANGSVSTPIGACLVLTGLTLTASILASSVTYRVVEMRFTKFGKALVQQRQRAIANRPMAAGADTSIAN